MTHNTLNINGLILSGGKSKRMGADKSALVYHDKPQVQVCYHLLKSMGCETFISCRIDQADAPHLTDYQKIYDQPKYENQGPLAGILSAFSYEPEAAWLVVACDLPFLNKDVLKQLMDQRDQKFIATAFQSAHDQLPEPLCAIYEPSARPVLEEFFSKGVLCPRKILTQSQTKLLTPHNKTALDNVNLPEEFEQARKNLEA
jgi:molybdopterin-guanine dinucleotide biosynthesis protein A